MRLKAEPTCDQSMLPNDQQHHSITIETEGDDLDFDDMVDLFKALLYGLGYHHETVEQLSGDE